jgi:hypothetical protein
MVRQAHHERQDLISVSLSLFAEDKLVADFFEDVKRWRDENSNN